MPRTAQSAYMQMLEGNPNNKTKKELSKRSKNEKKLSVSAENMIAPSWLSRGAKNEFNRIVGLFQDSGILNEADIGELAIYCDALSDYKALGRIIKKHGRSAYGDVSPFLKEKRQLLDKLDKLARSLGLTPAARASFAINLKNDDSGGDDEDEDF